MNESLFMRISLFGVESLKIAQGHFIACSATEPTRYSSCEATARIPSSEILRDSRLVKEVACNEVRGFALLIYRQARAAKRFRL